MDNTVKKFLDSQRVSVVSILQEDTSLHAAALHFACTEDPFHFFFATDKNTRKVRPLVKGGAVNAALVIGFSEDDFTTFQAEGTIEILKDDAGWETYLQKFPDRESFRKNPDSVILQFTPTWWRYTNMSVSPKLVITSDS